jgi:hypothetical protein
LRIGERVAFNQRAYKIVGFTPMSVEPACLLLEDGATRKTVEVKLEELERELHRAGAPGEPAPHELARKPTGIPIATAAMARPLAIRIARGGG